MATQIVNYFIMMLGIIKMIEKLKHNTYTNWKYQCIYYEYTRVWDTTVTDWKTYHSYQFYNKEHIYGEYYTIAFASVRGKKKILWMILHISFYVCKLRLLVAKIFKFYLLLDPRIQLQLNYPSLESVKETCTLDICD